MLRLLLAALLAALIGGGVYFFWNYQIERHYEDGKFAYLKVTPRTRGHNRTTAPCPRGHGHDPPGHAATSFRSTSGS